MSKHLRILIVAALLVGVLAMSAGSVAQARQKVTITWFVGLGTGSNPEQQAAQEQVVDDFNKSQDNIELVLNITLNQVAQDTLSTLIAGGTPPDIVGPVGFQGANLFGEEWLDLQPLVESTGYQLEQYPASLVDSYRELATGALTGLPFAVYPGVLYYNVDLFDEAGLNYPPAVAGDPYVMPDGTEVPWDYDTVANIGKILTVDANGNDATSPDFDPNNIVQYGFIHQWDTIRSDFSTFGAAPVVNADGKVQFPDAWRAEAHWLWDSIWTWHITPTDGVISSELLNSNAFASGKVAMARSMAWYTCCLNTLTSAWDLAVQPAYQGTIYAPIDLDTFRIDKNTPHPDEAFTVLTYLLGDAELDLTTVYGAFPARPELQDAWIQAKAAQYPSVTHWEVIPDSIALAPNPHHEEWYPGFNKGQNRFQDFRTLIGSDGGGAIDVNAEFDKLQSDIQAIVDEAQQ
jgi:multiple sugar transport system substrate-binding protein